MRFNKTHLIAICILSAQATMAQQAEPMNFSNEKIIDTTNYVKAHDEVEDQGAKFARHFKHKDHNNLNSQAELVNIGKMVEKLYLPVRQLMYRDNECKRKRCVAAVQITHSLVNEKLTLIYEPLYMKLKEIVLHPQADSMKYDRFVFLNQKFTYQGGNFIPINAADYTNQKALYKNNIIKQPNNGGGAPNTPLGPYDPNGVVFSFQEILKFNHAVYGRDADGNYYANEMEIHHGAAFYKDRTSSPNATAKHTLFVTKKDWTTLKADKKAKGHELKILMPASDGDGANLAHLCPPRCSDLSYPQQE